MLNQEEALKIDLGEIPRGWIEVIPEKLSTHEFTRKFRKITIEVLDKWLKSKKGSLPADKTERIKVKTERVEKFMETLEEVTERISWNDYCYQECGRMVRNGLIAAVLKRRSSPGGREFCSVIRKGQFTNGYN